MAADAAAGGRPPRGVDPVGAGARAARRPRRGLGRARGRRPPRRAPGRPLGRPPRDHRRALSRRGDLRRPRRPAARLAHAARPARGRRRSTAPLVVTPAALELPADAGRRRAWGLMTQLYSVRSRALLGPRATSPTWPSWPAWSGAELGADFVLVNPLHAAEPVAADGALALPADHPPVRQPDLHPGRGRPRGRLPGAPPSGAASSGTAEATRARSTPTGRHSTATPCGQAKRRRSTLVFALPRAARPAAGLRGASVDREGQGLVDFATWCALAEMHGLPLARWPEELRDPALGRRGGCATELADRGRLPLWLQWVPRRAAGAAQRRGAATPGWRLGVVHDLAVGVHPRRRRRLGAPRRAGRGGQRRGAAGRVQPAGPGLVAAAVAAGPARRRLGYAPYRDMLRTVLRHAGGIRVDHVIGLFRLWWVPDGHWPRPRAPTCAYDHEALVGILALEAERAGALVVGEDLGTVEPWVRDYLRERGILGTSILWFERDEPGRPLPARALARAVPGHRHHARPAADRGLPRRRAHRPARAARAADPPGRGGAPPSTRPSATPCWRCCASSGCCGPAPTERDVVEALHRFLAWTPARLVGRRAGRRRPATAARSTSPAPTTSTRTGGCRWPTAGRQPVLLEDVMASRGPAGWPARSPSADGAHRRTRQDPRSRRAPGVLCAVAPVSRGRRPAPGRRSARVTPSRFSATSRRRPAGASVCASSQPCVASASSRLASSCG